MMMFEKIKTVVFGATGMIGEGVLQACLEHPDVSDVMVIGRRTCGKKHPKMKECIHNDFSNMELPEQDLSGFNACFFCLGVSSIGLNEEQYRKITQDITLEVANTLIRINPNMIFCYVSGMGTDSSEKGRSMWARVKGETENRLLAMPFKAAYMFRPGYINPVKGYKNTIGMYRFFAPFYPLWKAVFPKYVSTLQELAMAMIRTARQGFDKPILESVDIVKLGRSEMADISDKQYRS